MFRKAVVASDPTNVPSLKCFKVVPPANSLIHQTFFLGVMVSWTTHTRVWRRLELLDGFDTRRSKATPPRRNLRQHARRASVKLIVLVPDSTGSDYLWRCRRCRLESPSAADGSGQHFRGKVATCRGAAQPTSEFHNLSPAPDSLNCRVNMEAHSHAAAITTRLVLRQYARWRLCRWRLKDVPLFYGLTESLVHTPARIRNNVSLPGNTNVNRNETLFL